MEAGSRLGPVRIWCWGDGEEEEEWEAEVGEPGGWVRVSPVGTRRHFCGSERPCCQP